MKEVFFFNGLNGEFTGLTGEFVNGQVAVVDFDGRRGAFQAVSPASRDAFALLGHETETGSFQGTLYWRDEFGALVQEPGAGRTQVRQSKERVTSVCDKCFVSVPVATGVCQNCD
jgi:hypothetical protein